MWLVLYSFHICIINSCNYTIPTLWIYGKPHFDIDRCINAIESLLNEKESKVLLLNEPIYTVYMEELYERLIKSYPNLQHQIDIRYHNKTITPNILDNIKMSGKVIPLKQQNEEIEKVIYIGNKNKFLDIIKLKYSYLNSLIWYNTEDENIKEIDNLYKELNKRYINIEKIRNSNCICLLIVDIGIDKMSVLLDKMKKLIKNSEKQYYVITMSKVNECKLLNFGIIDCFIVCGSPLSILLHFDEFPYPICTPYELFVALDDEIEWNSNYIVDIDDLISLPLPESCNEENSNKDKISLDREEEEESSEIISIDKTLSKDVLNSYAMEKFKEKEYHGLDIEYNKDIIPDVTQGLKGVASGYSKENKFLENEDIEDLVK